MLSSGDNSLAGMSSPPPRIAISSGHALHVAGARELLDEVTEARKVANRVAELLGITAFHDNTSSRQPENLAAIIKWHNAQVRNFDISIHFNAFRPTAAAMGTETLYLTAQDLAAKVSREIAAASGLRNRGPKKRINLAFLNRTQRPAILIEVCFLDSNLDVRLYTESFDKICTAIAGALSGSLPS